MSAILVLNSGSSSLKFGLFAITSAQRPGAVRCKGQVDGIGGNARLVMQRSGREPQARKLDGANGHASALKAVLECLQPLAAPPEIAAVGHRIVHGGEEFSGPVRLDDAILGKLERLTPLAPLHQPHNLAAVRAISSQLPGKLQVACFDTAFHREQPPLAQAFALPRRLTEAGIRRYGFHGLSYDFVSRQLPRVLEQRGDGAVVVAHLGAGASLCALKHRRSVATTMGFTALDGLMMNTRCGSLDPGVLLYLMSEFGMDAAALSRLLYHESGLLGVSGLSGDMRELLRSSAPEAREAVELYCYRVAREAGSMMAAAGGLDALVFTAGIGENSPQIRERIGALLAWTGLRIDPGHNAAGRQRIDAADSSVAVAVIATDEERIIAEYTLAQLAT